MKMKLIQQQFRVQYAYPVFFTHELFGPENGVWAKFLLDHKTSGTRLLFILDAEMMRCHGGLKDQILQTLSRPGLDGTPAFFLEMPGGEQIKNDPARLEEMLSAIDRYSIDRHSFVVAIGGGALLDAAGFAAAVAHRGVRHIRIPTTVLSQNDSGIGVKNGVNHFGKKNFLGAFAPPFAVFNDSLFLTTLDDRQWRSGMSEAVKVALIRDAGFFSWLETEAAALVARQMPCMEELIYRCAALHMEHIASKDPFESGSSRPLDFGHWSAHKLEQLSAFSLLHGEAVATGIALDALYSRETGWLSADETERILRLLTRLGFTLYQPQLEEAALMEGLREFREHLGGKLTIMMLREIGRGENVHQLQEALIGRCVEMLKRYHPAPEPHSVHEPL